jgi:pyruvate kinase
VGVANATTDLRQGEIVTLDVPEGLVHRGARSPNADPYGAIL